MKRYGFRLKGGVQEHRFRERTRNGPVLAAVLEVLEPYFVADIGGCQLGRSPAGDANDFYDGLVEHQQEVHMLPAVRMAGTFVLFFEQNAPFVGQQSALRSRLRLSVGTLQPCHSVVIQSLSN